MFKRGQAAMEFLMTYGWAILVVLAAIGALAYFGVLNQDQFVPEKCLLDAGIACDGYKITPSTSKIVMTNGMGRDLVINSIEVGSCSKVENITFDAGDQITVELSGCTNGDNERKFTGDITIGYTEYKTGLTKTHRGSLITEIEAE